MIRLLVPAPLAQALDAADVRLRALSAILGAPRAGADARDALSTRVCIVGEHWAAFSRDALETTVKNVVASFERGEITADVAAREVFRALSRHADESTQPG